MESLGYGQKGAFSDIGRNGCKPNTIMYPITYPFVFKDAYTISTMELVEIDSLHMLDWLMLHFAKNIAWKQKIQPILSPILSPKFLTAVPPEWKNKCSFLI